MNDYPNMKERAAKLPEIAFVDNKRAATDLPLVFGEDGKSPPPVLAIKSFVAGYHPIYTPLSADELNASRGVTPAQREAMFAGSMFGWHVPAADPDSYNADGSYVDA